MTNADPKEELLQRLKIIERKLDLVLGIVIGIMTSFLGYVVLLAGSKLLAN